MRAEYVQHLLEAVCQICDVAFSVRVAAERNRDIEQSLRIDGRVDVQQVHPSAIRLILRGNQPTFCHSPLIALMRGRLEATEIIKANL